MTTFKSWTIAMALAIVSLNFATAGVKFDNETLKYKVMYKWGLISKVAGYATLDLRTGGSDYKASLVAKSAPWADKLYPLRDTLFSTISPQTLMPSSYTYIAHENGKYVKDVVKFYRSGNSFTGKVSRVKRNKKGEWDRGEATLQANGATVDLLSLFFYIRSIDFPAMAVGSSKTVNCFSGKKSETVTVTYKGLTTIDIDDKKQSAFNVAFRFTQNGKTSSSPINAWITTDARRIPLQVEGSLPVGKIRVVLDN